jgi:hypothetical protein
MFGECFRGKPVDGKNFALLRQDRRPIRTVVQCTVQECKKISLKTGVKQSRMQ